MKIRYLITVGTFNLQLSHLQNTIADSQDDRTSPMLLTCSRGQNISSIFQTLMMRDLLSKNNRRIKRPCLLSKLIYQLTT
ncbi:hypothetical protein D3C76_1821520 [compost metagenome]